MMMSQQILISVIKQNGYFSGHHKGYFPLLSVKQPRAALAWDTTASTPVVISVPTLRRRCRC